MYINNKWPEKSLEPNAGLELTILRLSLSLSYVENEDVVGASEQLHLSDQ